MIGAVEPKSGSTIRFSNSLYVIKDMANLKAKFLGTIMILLENLSSIHQVGFGKLAEENKDLIVGCTYERISDDTCQKMW